MNEATEPGEEASQRGEVGLETGGGIPSGYRCQDCLSAVEAKCEEVLAAQVRSWF